MIDKVLEERASRYGTFKDHSAISQGLQEVLWNSPKWKNIPLDTRQAFVVICDKMARAINGDPEYDDNLVDIIGYATLVLNRIHKDKVTEHLNESALFDFTPSPPSPNVTQPVKNGLASKTSWGYTLDETE